MKSFPFLGLYFRCTRDERRFGLRRARGDSGRFLLKPRQGAETTANTSMRLICAGPRARRRASMDRARPQLRSPDMRCATQVGHQIGNHGRLGRIASIRDADLPLRRPRRVGALRIGRIEAHDNKAALRRKTTRRSSSHDAAAQASPRGLKSKHCARIVITHSDKDTVSRQIAADLSLDRMLASHTT